MSDDSDIETSGDRVQNHRTIDRVTRILEEVVYSPGLSFTDLVRALDAPKSSVHGFVRGLLASGWLYEESGRFYLGPAIYGLTMASGQIRAGAVAYADLNRMYADTGVAAFLGVRAGDHLIYVAEGGNDQTAGFYARTNIRRPLHKTAGGKALLATLPDAQLEAYFRRKPKDEAQDLFRFLDEVGEIRQTGVARNFTRDNTRYALGSVVRDRQGAATTSITLVAPTPRILPRSDELAGYLLKTIAELEKRSLSSRGGT